MNDYLTGLERALTDAAVREVRNARPPAGVASPAEAAARPGPCGDRARAVRHSGCGDRRLRRARLGPAAGRRAEPADPSLRRRPDPRHRGGRRRLVQLPLLLDRRTAPSRIGRRQLLAGRPARGRDPAGGRGAAVEQHPPARLGSPDALAGRGRSQPLLRRRHAAGRGDQAASRPDRPGPARSTAARRLEGRDRVRDRTARPCCPGSGRAGAARNRRARPARSERDGPLHLRKCPASSLLDRPSPDVVRDGHLAGPRDSRPGARAVGRRRGPVQLRAELVLGQRLEHRPVRGDPARGPQPPHPCAGAARPRPHLHGGRLHRGRGLQRPDPRPACRPRLADRPGLLGAA